MFSKNIKVSLVWKDTNNEIYPRKSEKSGKHDENARSDQQKLAISSFT